METVERPMSESLIKAKKKREDTIWLASILGLAGLGMGWIFSPASGFLQVVIALVVGGVCAYIGTRLADKAK